MPYRKWTYANRTRATITLVITSAVLVLFFVEYPLPLKPDKVDLLFRAILLLFWSNLIVDRISDVGVAYTADVEHNEIKGFFENLPSILAGPHHLMYFSSIIDSRHHFVQLAQSALSIRNTVLRYGASESADADDHGYKEWLTAKKEAILKRRISVTEIVSCHLGPSDVQRNFMKELANNSHYRFVELDDVRLPMMQLTIFEFASDGANSKEVVFGWEFPESDQAASFASRNPKLVEYFEKYFSKNLAIAQERAKEDPTLKDN